MVERTESPLTWHESDNPGTFCFIEVPLKEILICWPSFYTVSLSVEARTFSPLKTYRKSLKLIGSKWEKGKTGIGSMTCKEPGDGVLDQLTDWYSAQAERSNPISWEWKIAGVYYCTGWAKYHVSIFWYGIWGGWQQRLLFWLEIVFFSSDLLSFSLCPFKLFMFHSLCSSWDCQ